MMASTLCMIKRCLHEINWFALNSFHPRWSLVIRSKLGTQRERQWHDKNMYLALPQEPWEFSFSMTWGKVLRCILFKLASFAFVVLFFPVFSFFLRQLMYAWQAGNGWRFRVLLSWLENTKTCPFDLTEYIFFKDADEA